MKRGTLRSSIFTLAVSVFTAVPVAVLADPPVAPQLADPSQSDIKSSHSVSPPTSLTAGGASDATHATPNNGKTAPAGAVASTNRSRGFDRNAVLDRSLSRGQYLVRTALGYRGLPYRWGGTSPRSGFDCSGLVQTVYAKWGIYLPRCASEQVTQGKPVPKDQLQAGDLVFFKNTYKHGLSHVGIYVGEGWFIHAASRRTGVILSRLDAAYHLNHWYGARRINLSKLPPAPGEQPQVPPRVMLEDPAHPEIAAPEQTSPQAPDAYPDASR